MSRHEPEPSHREIQELLGVYALDAVDPDTAAMVERHLGECVRCSMEVAQHHEVAGLLANSGGASPAALWAVTVTLMVEPTLLGPSSRLEVVAPEIAEQPSPALLQLCHW